MSSTITELPLHEVILKIMFHENIEKAAAMTSEDVLWRIDNPEISERQVREVLDWLVRQKKVELYLGKYSIDRIEFLDQKEIYEQSLVGLEKSNRPKSIPKSSSPNKNKKPPVRRKTFYVNPPKVKKNTPQIYLLIFGILSLAYVTYTFLEVETIFVTSETLKQDSESIITTIPKLKQLYISEDEEYTESARNAISYSFYRQNVINRQNVKEINRLQFLLDSITASNKKEIISLEEELQKSSNDSNTMLKKIILSNFIIIILFLFIYFKPKN